MLYRNVKTGAEFESESVCNGGNWVTVTPAPPEEKKAYFTARRLLRLLNLIEPLDEDAIPNNSILKEFIGGSAFAKEL